MVKLTKQTEERHSESRMRQIRKSGSMRGREASDGFSPYSTLNVHEVMGGIDIDIIQTHVSYAFEAFEVRIIRV